MSRTASSCRAQPRDAAAPTARCPITALWAYGEGGLYDYVGGRPDIKARRVRCIGNAASRIAEYYRRILHFFRFHAAYGEGRLDPEGLAACIAGRDGLDRLSRERV